MKLTVVGCTGSMSGPASAASCYLVQADGVGDDGATRVFSILLDLGPGAFGQLMNHLDPRDVDLVVLSHLHADHMADMIGYHVFRRWYPTGALGPVDVLAPPDAVDRVRGVGGDGPEEDFSADFTFRAHEAGHVVRVGPLRIESHRVEHPVEAWAVRVTGPSASGGGEVSLTYSGDTDACDGLVAAARDVDLFLCEAGFVEGRDTVRGIHLTGERAGEVATQARARHLVLTHIQPWTEPEEVAQSASTRFAGGIEVARTGSVWEL